MTKTSISRDDSQFFAKGVTHKNLIEVIQITLKLAKKLCFQENILNRTTDVVILEV